MDDVITIKELNDCLDMIFKNKDNDNVIFIDKDMKKELCRTYKLLFDYSKLLEKRINKAIEYCEEITSREIDISDTDYELGEDFTARDILKILRGDEDE